MSTASDHRTAISAQHRYASDDPEAGSLEPSPATDDDLSIHQLYHYALQLLAKLSGLIDCHQCELDGATSRIRQSLMHLYMWAQGLDLRSFEINASRTTTLQATVTRQLAGIIELIRALSNGKARVDKYDPTSSEIDFLVGKFAARDDSDSSEIDSSEDDEKTNEPASVFTESSLRTSPAAVQTKKIHEKHRQCINLLGIHVRCLMDLVPTMEHHDEEGYELNLGNEAPPTMTGTESLTMIQPYIMQIKDKFSSISDSLANRLGQANQVRYQRLQLLSRHGEDETSEQNIKVNMQAFAPTSEFQDSGLGVSLPSHSQYARSAASHRSMLSTQSARDKGVVRVPPTPAAVEAGLSFTCPICKSDQLSIRNRIDWKLHVFADIRPYVCTFENCNQPAVTFPTRKMWVDHERSRHPYREFWRCSRCNVEHPSHELLWDHLNTTHPEELSQTTTASSPSGVKYLAKAVWNECPMCGKIGLDTQPAWSAHVGKHLEEIALIVLPRSVEDEDDSDEDDDNDNKDGRDIDKKDVAANAVDDKPILPSLSPRWLTSTEASELMGKDLSHAEWQMHESIIMALYLNKGYSLEGIQRIMRLDYGFNASQSDLAERLAGWTADRFQDSDTRLPKLERSIPKLIQNIEEPPTGTADLAQIHSELCPPRSAQLDFASQNKIFCAFCGRYSQGFDIEYECERHMVEQHSLRRVWICLDISKDRKFLSDCKACRNNKTYGAYYNATAHLRRIHFDPISGGRRARNSGTSKDHNHVGSGNITPMEELKKWTRECWEVMINGRFVLQDTKPEPLVGHDGPSALFHDVGKVEEAG